MGASLIRTSAAVMVVAFALVGASSCDESEKRGAAPPTASEAKPSGNRSGSEPTAKVTTSESKPSAETETSTAEATPTPNSPAKRTPLGPLHIESCRTTDDNLGCSVTVEGFLPGEEVHFQSTSSLTGTTLDEYRVADKRGEAFSGPVFSGPSTISVKVTGKESGYSIGTDYKVTGPQ